MHSDALCKVMPKQSVLQLLGCPLKAAVATGPLTDVKLVTDFGMKRAIISVSYIILHDQIHGQVQRDHVGSDLCHSNPPSNGDLSRNMLASEQALKFHHQSSFFSFKIIYGVCLQASLIEGEARRKKI